MCGVCVSRSRSIHPQSVENGYQAYPSFGKNGASVVRRSIDAASCTTTVLRVQHIRVPHFGIIVVLLCFVRQLDPLFSVFRASPSTLSFQPTSVLSVFLSAVCICNTMWCALSAENDE